MSAPFPFNPLATSPLSAHDILNPIRDGFDTREAVSELIPNFVAYAAANYISQWNVDDAMQLSILNSLSRITNEETLALGHARIPTTGQTDDTLRVGIAYLHEKALGMPAVIAEIRENHIISSGGKFRINIFEQTRAVATHVETWVRRAIKIMEIMRDARAKVGTLAQDADFIRNAALITLGDIPGLQLTTTGNAVKIGRIENEHLQYYRLVEDNAFMVTRLDGAQNDDADQMHNQQDGLQVMAKNGMALVRTKTAKAKNWTEVLVAQDSTQTLTVAQLKGNVEARPLFAPKTATALAAVSIETTEARTVTLASAFSGDRLSYAAVAVDTDLVTVSIATAGPSVVLESQARTGTTTVKVTATNEAGSARMSFQVTVAQASE